MKTDEIESIGKLEKLMARHGERGFGFILQVLLALTFHRIGFQIDALNMPSGHPDIAVSKVNERYAIEVKTCYDLDVVFQKRDLNGVKREGYLGIVAAMFPRLGPTWCLCDVRHLSTGRKTRDDLKRGSQLEKLENEINTAFPEVLRKYFLSATRGAGALAKEISPSENPQRLDFSTFDFEKWRRGKGFEPPMCLFYRTN